MKKSSLGYILLALVALALVSLACGTVTTSSGGDAASAYGKAPASCDSPADPLGPGQTSQHMDDATEGYPANCSYYCTEVLSGADSLKIDVSNFSEDLDLYLGLGSITAVKGVDPESNPWKSNDTGTGDESVTISNPEAGVYYIEICSYDGKATDYNVKITVP